MKNHYAIFSQPPEENSLVLNPTKGCSYNKCAFCALYKDRKFRVLDLKEMQEQVDRIPGDMTDQINRIFLGEGNALAAETTYLKKLLAILTKRFPNLQGVSLYGTAQTIAKKAPRELTTLRKAGIDVIHMGMETGSIPMLKLLKKGASRKAMIDSGAKVKKSGIRLSVSVLIGAGGHHSRRIHVTETAAVLNIIQPQIITVRTLLLIPGTPLFDSPNWGTHSHPTPIETMIELRQMVSALELHETFFTSRHTSNSIQISGRLPEKKPEILSTLEQALNNPSEQFFETKYFYDGS